MPFAYHNGELCVDGAPLTNIADAVGTPAYVYSWPDVRERLARVERALGGIEHRVCYAVKANGNLSVLARLAASGTGFDIVSGGELERVLRAGGDPSKVVFSGVGKSVADIDFAIKCGVDVLNVESASELERIAVRAKLLGRCARIAVRVNPDVDPGTHPYIATGLKESKFGVPREEALALSREAAQSPELNVVGVACHIGSQISRTAPFQDALAALLALVDELAAHGIRVEHVDIGGGFGVRYREEEPLDVDALGCALRQALDGRRLKLIVEPGRFLVADAGALLTRVEYLKPASVPKGRNYAVVGRRHERPAPAGAVSGMARCAAGLRSRRVCAKRGCGDALEHRGPGLRERRLPGVGQGTCACGRGAARHSQRRRLWLRAEFQLQTAA